MDINLIVNLIDGFCIAVGTFSILISTLEELNNNKIMRIMFIVLGLTLIRLVPVLVGYK